jgi:Holliday junction resolvasome RuvABC endonuclease subunit
MNEFVRAAVGIDPGYRSCAIAYLTRNPSEVWHAREVRTVQTSSRESFHARCGKIYQAMTEVVFGVGYEPLRRPIIACESQIAVEGARSRGETSYEAVLVQQVVGLARAVAFHHELQFIEVPPADVKAVLRGIPRAAPKEQVARAVRAIVRGCPAKMSSHASDAVATALAGARLAR